MRQTKGGKRRQGQNQEIEKNQGKKSINNRPLGDNLDADML